MVLTLPSFAAVGDSPAQYGMTDFLYGMVTFIPSRPPWVRNSSSSSLSRS